MLGDYSPTNQGFFTTDSWGESLLVGQDSLAALAHVPVNSKRNTNIYLIKEDQLE